MILQANTSDDDIGDTITIDGFDITGTKGDVTAHGDGTFTYNPNGQFEYFGVDETAVDRFTYTVIDNSGATNTAAVIITITSEISFEMAPPGGFRFYRQIHTPWLRNYHSSFTGRRGLLDQSF